ncbi:MAG: hypothetical protein FWE95_02080 [Planctomycetaceae bacterium]|nr:hypothetical protein [Planctomycetaceae bacterium]
MGTWTANYDGNQIRIEQSWFSGRGKIFVNNKQQDERTNSFLGGVDLTGHVVSKDGERKPIKVSLDTGLFREKCLLFIDDEKVEVRKT